MRMASGERAHLGVAEQSSQIIQLRVDQHRPVMVRPSVDKLEGGS